MPARPIAKLNLDDDSMPTMDMAGARGRSPSGEPASLASMRTISPADTASKDAPAIGAIDHYELVRKLGGGGFGVVYLARDSVSGVEVAIKTLHPLLKHDDEEMEQLRGKFALVSRLSHPNIASPLVLHPVRNFEIRDEMARRDLRLSSGDSVMVMRYAPGITLSRWRRQFNGGIVPLDLVKEIALQVADALDYAHSERIVHRDIKPANVMVETLPAEASRPSHVESQKPGEQTPLANHHSLVTSKIRARILDFGLAAEIRSSLSLRSIGVGDTSGTRPYMAPEQWMGRKQDGRTDQYALACVLYELLSGAPPFAGAFDSGDPAVMAMAVENRRPDQIEYVPKRVNDVLARALAKNPEERFPSCGAFARALARESDGAFAASMAKSISESIGRVPELLTRVRDKLSSLSDKALAGVIAAAIIATVASVLAISKMSCSHDRSAHVTTTPAFDAGMPKDLQKLIPDGSASIDDLVAAKDKLDKFRAQNPQYWTRVAQERSALDERIELLAKKKIEIMRNRANVLREQLKKHEFVQWNAYEKCDWQNDSLKCANEFTRKYEAFTDNWDKLQRIKMDHASLSDATKCIGMLEALTKWILENAPVREELQRLEKDVDKHYGAIYNGNRMDDVDVTGLGNVRKTLLEAKALRDKGDFNGAREKYAEAERQCRNAEGNTAKRKSARLNREAIARLLKEIEEDARAATTYQWQDKAYNGWRKTISDVKDQVGSSGYDDASVANAKDLRKASAAALAAMKAGDGDRREFAKMERDLASLADDLAQSQAEKHDRRRLERSRRLEADAVKLCDEGQFKDAADTLAEAFRERTEAIANGYYSIAEAHASHGEWAKCIGIAERVPEKTDASQKARKLRDRAANQLTKRREEDERELKDIKDRANELAKGRTEYDQWQDPPYASKRKKIEEALVALKGFASAEDLEDAKAAEDIVKKTLAWMRENADARREIDDMAAAGTEMRKAFLAKHGLFLANDDMISGAFSKATEAARDAAAKRDAGDYAKAIFGYAAVTNGYGEAIRLAERKEMLSRISSLKEKLGQYEQLEGEHGLRKLAQVKWDLAMRAKNDGYTRLEEGYWTEAEKLLQEACGLLDEVYPSIREKKAESFVVAARKAMEERRWKECLSFSREARKWNPDNSEALSLGKEARVLAEPKDGERFSIKIRDIRDKSGKTTNSLELAYSMARKRWESIAPVSQGQWLSVLQKPPLRFVPERDSANANFINKVDVGEWIKALTEREECAGWDISSEFRDGSGKDDSLNSRKGTSSFRIRAKLRDL